MFLIILVGENKTLDLLLRWLSTSMLIEHINLQAMQSRKYLGILEDCE